MGDKPLLPFPKGNRRPMAKGRKTRRTHLPSRYTRKKPVARPRPTQKEARAQPPVAPARAARQQQTPAQRKVALKNLAAGRAKRAASLRK